MEAVERVMISGKAPPRGGWLAFALAVAINTGIAIGLRGIVLRLATVEGTPLVERLTGLLWLGSLAYPLVAGAKAVVFAAITWNAAVVLNRETAFSSILRVFLWGELIQVMNSLGTLVVYFLRGIDSIHSAAHLEAHWGIGLITGVSNRWLALLDTHADVFDVIWFVYVVGGLIAATGMSRPAVLALTGFLWLLLALTGIAVSPQGL